MSLRADYQLRHQLFGQQGSLWERQADDTTRTRVRRIVKAGGNASVLSELDQIAATVVNASSVLVEDVFFRFADGNFAVVGQPQRDYAFRKSVLDDGTRLHFAYRRSTTTKGNAAIPTQIALVSADFLRLISAADGTFSADRDWYLVPIPYGMTPLVIEGRGEDVFLVNGIDFTSRDGYIVMTDDPAIVLPTGLVRVCSAYRKVSPANSFVLSATPDRFSSRYLAEYTYKTQSMAAFKRAAAEYAGLYVVKEADVVLEAREVAEDVWVYGFAKAGAVEIDYIHTPLKKYQQLQPGFIISGQFDVVMSEKNDAVDLKKLIAYDWPGSVRLNGIFPVNGLTWDGKSLVEVTASGGTPKHLHLHFDGLDEDLQRLWDFQDLHETQTGVYLSNLIGLPSYIDFWDFLFDFYGSQLCLVLFANHSPAINVRMWHFMLEHHPQSCNLIYGNDLGVIEDTLRFDDQGVPMLDEYGGYSHLTEPIDPERVYYRPGGVNVYYRPDGVSFYLIPV